MSTEAPKTSTFVIDHARCNPGAWTPHDVLTLLAFIATGSMEKAARLRELGMELAASEHHVAKGGQIEEIGCMEPGGDGIYESIDDVYTYGSGKAITPFRKLYAGPVQYAVEWGGEDGREYHVADTKEEAEKFIAEIQF